MKQVTVFAPASIGNVGPGFDVLGLCLENPGDELTAWKTDKPGVHIESIIGDNGILSLEPTQNTASIPMLAYLRDYPQSHGVAFSLKKKMPFGSGLGSSAASAVAGAFAINALFGNILSKNDLLPYALEGEFFASKAMHPDNVAPSLFGGLQLAQGNFPFNLTTIPTPTNAFFTLIYQNVHIATADARKVLPPNYSLKPITNQLSLLAGLVAGFCTSDLNLVGKSLNDVLIEPYRSKLIPHFDTLKTIAIENGALGFTISGSGPTCFALSDNLEIAQIIANCFTNFLTSKNTKHQTYISKVNTEGVKIIHEIL